MTYFDGIEYKNQKLSSNKTYKFSVAAKVIGVEKLVATEYSYEGKKLELFYLNTYWQYFSLLIYFMVILDVKTINLWKNSKV